MVLFDPRRLSGFQDREDILGVIVEVFPPESEQGQRETEEDQGAGTCSVAMGRSQVRGLDLSSFTESGMAFGGSWQVSRVTTTVQSGPCV